MLLQILHFLHKVKNPTEHSSSSSVDALVFGKGQSLISLSTAESEIMESMESLMAGESVAVIAEELQGDLLKMAWSNQAATVILTAEGGNWRTRHLKMSAGSTSNDCQQRMDPSPQKW